MYMYACNIANAIAKLQLNASLLCGYIIYDMLILQLATLRSEVEMKVH